MDFEDLEMSEEDRIELEISYEESLEEITKDLDNK